MSEPDAIANAIYRQVLKTIAHLVAMDPPSDSPEARLLAGLAKAAEDYERARWPLPMFGETNED